MPNLIPFNHCVWCVSCRTFSDAKQEYCPACGESGTLLSMARILEPSPELGAINFIFAGEVARA